MHHHIAIRTWLIGGTSSRDLLSLMSTDVKVFTMVNILTSVLMFTRFPGSREYTPFAATALLFVIQRTSDCRYGQAFG